MKTKNYITGSILFLVMLACAVPGLSQPASPPTFDPSTIPTMVVLTANAAISQTAAAQPVATEIPAGMTNTTIVQVQDGTTKYSDYDGGFEIIFPVGWLAVRPNSDEFTTSLANEGAVNSMLHDQMTADLAGYEANYDRLYSYVLRPDIEKNAIFGFSKLVWDSETTLPLDNITMGELVRDLESSGAIPGFRADTVQLHEDSNVKMIEIGGRFTMSDGQGGNIPFYSTIIFFKPTSNSGVRVTFTFLEDYHAQISMDVKSIIESIRMIEP